MNEEVHTCVICQGDIEHQKDENGKVFWTRGHHAYPLAKGQCCNTCHSVNVMPLRVTIAMFDMLEGKK